jgi:hypothetical protein
VQSKKATIGWLFSWPFGQCDGNRLLAQLNYHLLERWMSGLSHTPGKRARGKTLRGFESRLLRQKKKKTPHRLLMRGFILSE